ncbi:uncharacterized protein LOC125719687 isoform X2 [Brienomyrus brachyistius]|uniref:uncharacterized protein LOC125719687 isoform X2 n=1 Tax=Brienomyrus brachyistius TaxID=42636 RepID=UPI0020B3EB99|nr:uncharacterized protein LOC125719687 isoform X2 [Brienomyrus brachyistius]
MVNWGSKSLWVMAGMVSFVLITFAITFSIQLGTQSNTHAKSPPANNDINGVYTDVHGVLSWEQKHPHERNISLSENKTHVITMTDGFYLVFVQVTYKINCSQATEYTDLMLTVNHFYEEGEQYYSAVFKTHCGTCGGCQQKGDPESVDVVLSQPTLLWMKQNDKLTVTVSHREFVEFIYYPTSTFLMVVKYSD